MKYAKEYGIYLTTLLYRLSDKSIDEVESVASIDDVPTANEMSYSMALGSMDATVIARSADIADDAQPKTYHEFARLLTDAMAAED